MNPQEICRCCLSEHPIFTHNIIHEHQLRHELLLCVPSVNIEPDDGLPEVICDVCCQRIREALDFRRRCEQNDRELRKQYDETNRAIEQALGELNLLTHVEDVREKQVQAHQHFEQHTDVHHTDVHHTDVQHTDVQHTDVQHTDVQHTDVQHTNVQNIDPDVVQLLEQYTDLEMSMLGDLMLDEHSISSLIEANSSIDDAQEDHIIKELLANFLNEPSVVANITETAARVDRTLTDAPLHDSTLNEFDFSTLEELADIEQTSETSSSSSSSSSSSKSTTKPASPKSLHPCSQCEKKFTRNFQLKLHLISVHGIGNGLQYMCSECSKTFASRHSLNYHLKAMHSMERPFECTHCQRRFVLRTQLTSHLRTHTGESKPRTHTCADCDKCFITKSDLKTHMRTHDPQVVRPFKCECCPKSFFTQGHLSSHKLVHTGEKPFRCGFCEKGYQNVGNLNNHIFRSHQTVLTGKKYVPQVANILVAGDGLN